MGRCAAGRVLCSIRSPSGFGRLGQQKATSCDSAPARTDHLAPSPNWRLLGLHSTTLMIPRFLRSCASRPSCLVLEAREPGFLWDFICSTHCPSRVRSIIHLADSRRRVTRGAVREAGTLWRARVEGALVGVKSIRAQMDSSGNACGRTARRLLATPDPFFEDSALT